MARSTLRFYHKGVDKQIKSDISVDLRRVRVKEIESWTPEQKEELLQWFETVERVFNAFKNEVTKHKEVPVK